MEEKINIPLNGMYVFKPHEDFVKKANINDPSVYERAEDDFLGFWEGLAENIDWFNKWDDVLKWSYSLARKMLIARSLFCNCDLSSWQATTIPDGMCVKRTAVAFF